MCRLYNCIYLSPSLAFTNHKLGETIVEGTHVEVKEAVHHGTCLGVTRIQAVVLAILGHQVPTDGTTVRGVRRLEMRVILFFNVCLTSSQVSSL